MIQEKLITSDQSIQFFEEIKKLNKINFKGLETISENLDTIIKKQVKAI